MKQLRLIAALLCFLFLFGCTGPFGQTTPRFYYLKNDIEFSGATSVIASESNGGIDTSGPLLTVLEEYLKGPNDGSLHSPFPEGIQIYTAEQREETVILEFNAVLADLTGMDLTLACACASMTCLELTDAQNVSIRARGATLDGATQITMDADSLLLLDSSGQ